MNSTFKGLLHTILGAIALILPTILAHYAGWSTITIGGFLSWAVNAGLSYTTVVAASRRPQNKE